MSALRGGAAAGSAVLLLSACAAVTAKPQRESILRIDPSTPVRMTPLGPTGEGRLALGSVTAGGAAAGRRYAYVEPTAPREVRNAASLFWEEPPPIMLDRVLQRGLSARLGQPVLDAQVAPGAGRRLNVELDRFEEESGVSAAAVVALRVTLISTKMRDVVFVRRYCTREPIRGATPSDRSTAFEGALTTILDALADDLTRNGASPQAAAC